MPAYMYPININRKPKTICYRETKVIEVDFLNLNDLAFVGSDRFEIEQIPFGYEITVYRTKLETKKQMQDRIKREEAYMVEYNKRH